MILRKAAREWDWIERAPHVPMYRHERSEPRFLTRRQFAALLSHLPPHLSALAEFSVETGLRMRNVTHLTWTQVDLRRRSLVVPASRAKSGETIVVPLSSRALAILRAQPRKIEQVFAFRGKRMDDANGAAFKAAAAAAGVPWLRWHDLRHTWASWHVQGGTPLHVVQELGGWRSYEMVRRYGHLSTAHLAAHVRRHEKGTRIRGIKRPRVSA
jgi:integrase